MIRFHKINSDRGLSFPAILISGITAAFFIFIAFFIIRAINMRWSPTAKNAQELINKRKYAEALAVIEKAEGGREENALLLVEKGKVWFSLALEREKRTRWKNYGNDKKDWLNSSEAVKAEVYLRKAIDIDPENIDAHYLLGLLYMEKGWFSVAETEFLSVLRIDRKHVNTLINLGALYTEMKRFDLAEQELRNALNLEPDNPSIAKNFAYLYRFYVKKPDSAIVWANRYLNMEPQNDMDVNYVRNELVEMLQRYPEYTPKEPMAWKKQRVEGRGILKYGKKKEE